MTNLQRLHFILGRCIFRGRNSREVERLRIKCRTYFHSQGAGPAKTPKDRLSARNLTYKYLSASLLSICATYYLFRKYEDSEELTNYWNDLKTAFKNAYVVRADGPSGGMRSQFNFIADIVEQAQPAVVFIEVVKGRGFRQMSSSGSGFIVRSDGLILTNAHVVAGASHVHVYLNDNKKVQGVVQAVDQVCDLATVKVQARNLPTLPLGKSTAVRPGEWVVALGSPFNLQKTVTAGVVSNPGRETMGNLTKSPPMIQHDAVINVGNSGGPLINLDGEAIGINTMTLTSGISFALPADLAVDFLNRAKKIEGRFPSSPPAKRTYVGLSVISLTPDLQMNLRKRVPNFPTNVEQGILIVSVISGSPAQSAGLLPTDVITHINRKPVTSTSDYFKAIETGQELTFQIARGNASFTVTVTPEEVD
ncbi:serine protease HTRA2, mitochondrial-like [Saccostrea echinata]|uniref:serine protease HTRA2, mitochondrial-like n=1 Tax=Saccostrea echinata TaxID=191078 RepID=UPI002A82F16F|nr:serine protease HTRA2, mitochondrial-like [Saccostrea echinata]